MPLPTPFAPSAREPNCSRTYLLRAASLGSATARTVVRSGAPDVFTQACMASTTFQMPSLTQTSG
eukprot:14132705-Alexandrium_andersonii.AAC.1